MRLSILFGPLLVCGAAALFLFLFLGGSIWIWLLGAWLISAPLTLIVARFARPVEKQQQQKRVE